MLLGNSDNPFEKLRLPSEASDREIVERGRELAREASPAERIAVREAVESLIRGALERIEHELFTFYEANYADDAAEEGSRQLRESHITSL